MADTYRAPVVVTFSPQPSVAYFLKGVLDCAGFAVVASSSNIDELDAAIQRTQPDAIVYDVSFPFVESWNQLQELRTRATAHDIPVVITTSEARELQRRIGVTAAVEIFRRPDDIAELRRTMQHAIEAATPVQAA